MRTLHEQIAEAQRELARRRTCSPAWIKAGTLDEGEAQWQLRVLEDMVRTLTRLDVEQRQLSLFGPTADSPPRGSTVAPPLHKGTRHDSWTHHHRLDHADRLG